MLEKRVEVTKEEFMHWLAVIVRDNVTAMRRACDTGKRRLESNGWLPNSPPLSRRVALASAVPPAYRALDAIDEAPESGPSEVAPPSPALVASRAPRTRTLDISLHGRHSFKPLPRALGRLSAQRTPSPLAECESIVAHLEI